MKKYWFCEKPAIMTEAEKAQRKFHPVILVVVYLLFTFVLMRRLNLAAAIAFPPFSDPSDYGMKLLVLAGLSYLVPLSLFLFFVRFVEKRSWASMGFVRNKPLKRYLILIGIVIVAAFLITYQMSKTILGMPTEAPLYAALITVAVWVYSLCHTVVLHGFLLVSLANRISMKNAVIVVSLLPLLYYAVKIITILIDASHMAPMNEGTSSIIIKDTLSTVATIFFTASCALLLLRTSHIWGVAILALFWSIKLDLLPFPYMQIVLIVMAAAILCAVLFLPKKTIEKQEGAGFVSQ